MRALAIVVVAGCFHPTIPAGAPCAEDGSCPGDLMCRAGRCESETSGTIDAPTVIDGRPIDAMIDAPMVCTTFSRQFETCTLAMGTALSIVGDWTYNTDLHELRNAGVLVPVTRALVAGKAAPIDALIVDSFDISAGSNLRVIGSAPFGIVARGAVTISGTIDASNGGAGSRTDTACGAAAGGVAPDGSHDQGPGGGGGGAFHGAGGTGGVGDANGTSEDGGAAGIAVGLPLGPLGGCPGGSGADGDAGTAGLRGRGGGAIYIAGATTLSVQPSGVIQVGGGGGGGGRGSAGSGGGGGAGGMILIEAPSPSIQGALVANGGGGGGGAENMTGVDGNNGVTGGVSANRAAGGAGGAAPEGGTGGGGGAGLLPAGATSTSMPDNGGGGGGGGVGYISIIGTATTTGALISPAATPFP